jgi:hypothetical protein
MRTPARPAAPSDGAGRLRRQHADLTGTDQPDPLGPTDYADDHPAHHDHTAIVRQSSGANTHDRFRIELADPKGGANVQDVATVVAHLVDEFHGAVPETLVVTAVRTA